ncbi:MAG: hypothetical protein ACT4P4_29880 [Betaproteobacteria bacterium]
MAATLALRSTAEPALARLLAAFAALRRRPRGRASRVDGAPVLLALLSIACARSIGLRLGLGEAILVRPVAALWPFVLKGLRLADWRYFGLALVPLLLWMTFVPAARGARRLRHLARPRARPPPHRLRARLARRDPAADLVGTVNPTG